MSELHAYLGTRWHRLVLALRPPPTERGASLVEYALLLALIAAVCIVAVSTFGSATGSSYESITQRFP